MKNIGKISQVIGPVVDVQFEENLPSIYNALEIVLNDGAASAGATASQRKLVLETQQHLGGGKVRAVAMGSTDGLKRAMEVTDTGAPISVPVGAQTLGRMFNLLGEAIDGSAFAEASADKSVGKPIPILILFNFCVPRQSMMFCTPLCPAEDESSAARYSPSAISLSS